MNFNTSRLMHDLNATPPACYGRTGQRSCDSFHDYVGNTLKLFKKSKNF